MPHLAQFVTLFATAKHKQDKIKIEFWTKDLCHQISALTFVLVWEMAFWEAS